MIPYFQESSVSGVSTVIWVNFDYAPAAGELPYIYYGNSGASSGTDGSSTFITFDGFERGNNGDAIDGSWSIIQGTPTISTAQKYSGTRSAKFAGAATYPYAYIPGTAVASNKAFQIRTYGLVHFGPYVLSGNDPAAYLAGFNVAETGHVASIGGASLGTVTGATVWHLWEMKNYNFTAHTFDLWLDGVSFATGIAMTASGFNAVGLENTDTTVGHDVYYDNAIVRNYVSLEPILGPWGAEENPPFAGGKLTGIGNKMVALGMI